MTTDIWFYLLDHLEEIVIGYYAIIIIFSAIVTLISGVKYLAWKAKAKLKGK